MERRIEEHHESIRTLFEAIQQLTAERPSANRGSLREVWEWKGGLSMPVISMFYGIVVMMFFDDCRKHRKPHIHVEYQGREAVVGIPDGKLLGGSLPPAKLKLVTAWVEIHKDELMADWALAARKEPVFKIDPLK